MSKSKIEDRLNTMRHKQAQPTDSLILAESAEGKDFSQELSGMPLKKDPRHLPIMGENDHEQ